MQRSMNDLNRMGERLLESENDLDMRIALTAEVKRPDFIRRVAAPAGAYMEDGIMQVFGIDGLRSALAAGPLEFFQEYERATQQRSRPAPPRQGDRAAARGGFRRRRGTGCERSRRGLVPRAGEDAAAALRGPRDHRHCGPILRMALRKGRPASRGRRDPRRRHPRPVASGTSLPGGDRGPADAEDDAPSCRRSRRSA